MCPLAFPPYLCNNKETLIFPLLLLFPSVALRAIKLFMELYVCGVSVSLFCFHRGLFLFHGFPHFSSTGPEKCIEYMVAAMGKNGKMEKWRLETWDFLYFLNSTFNQWKANVILLARIRYEVVPLLVLKFIKGYVRK